MGCALCQRMKTRTYALVVAGALASGAFTYADHDKSCQKETIGQPGHDKNCQRAHGKVTRVKDPVLFVDNKAYATSETTRLTKGDRLISLCSIKPGDLVCLDTGDPRNANGKLTAVTVLTPEDAAPSPSREIIRENEKVKKKIREEK